MTMTEFGKTSWPDILYYENKLKQVNPELRQQATQEAEFQKALEIFKNAK